MSFTFAPEDGRPARIMRFVEPGTLPAENFLAVYVKSQNLLVIDREHYERLSDWDRRQVLRTHKPYLEVEYPANQPARLAA